MAEVDKDFIEKTRKNKQTMRSLGRVAQKINQDNERGALALPASNHLGRAEDLTGLTKEYLATLDGNPITKYEELDWRAIHGALDVFYIGEQKLPTTKELFDSLYGNIPKHIDIRTFRLLLLKMGFIWKRIHVRDGTHRLVIMERPKLRFARYNYLNMSNQYRNKRNIYYVSETLLQFNEKTDSVDYCNLTHFNIHQLIEGDNKKYLYILCAVSRDGIYCFKSYDQFGPNTFKDWISHNVTQFQKPSIFVFTGDDYKDREIIKMPIENGIKIDMMEWLDYHNVPYDPDMSKHDLWALVKKYTNTVDKIYEIDSLLNVRGHLALRIPDSLKQLTPAFLVYKMVANNLPDQEFKDPYKSKWQETWSLCIKNVLVSIDSKVLKKFQEQVLSEELFLLNKEKQQDLNMDKMLQQSKFKTYKSECYDSDLPSWSDDD